MDKFIRLRMFAEEIGFAVEDSRQLDGLDFFIINKVICIDSALLEHKKYLVLYRALKYIIKTDKSNEVQPSQLETG